MKCSQEKYSTKMRLCQVPISRILANTEHPKTTHRLHSSSFLGLPYRILNMSHKKGLLWSLMSILQEQTLC